MGPYAQAACHAIKGILKGKNSIIEKLKSKFSEIEFNVRVASMGYRDLDDKTYQFKESTWCGGDNFTTNIRMLSNLLTLLYRILQVEVIYPRIT